MIFKIHFSRFVDDLITYRQNYLCDCSELHVLPVFNSTEPKAHR